MKSHLNSVLWNDILDNIQKKCQIIEFFNCGRACLSTEQQLLMDTEAVFTR